MSEEIISVDGFTTTERYIEKSRFICFCKHIESEEEGKNFVAEIKKKHSQATHNCFAYIADRVGNVIRFSDDGEPQGTAGLPILETIKNKKLYQTVVVVTRYFGGIKLGAGGLTRAYASLTSEVLDVAKKSRWALCEEYDVTVDYSNVVLFQKFVSIQKAKIIDSVYENDVRFMIVVEKSKAEDFIKQLKDYLLGKIKINKRKEYYISFSLE